MDNDVSKLTGVDSEVANKRRAAWRGAGWLQKPTSISLWPSSESAHNFMLSRKWLRKAFPKLKILHVEIVVENKSCLHSKVKQHDPPVSPCLVRNNPDINKTHTKVFFGLRPSLFSVHVRR